MDVLANYGLAGLVLLGAWRCAVWLAENVVKPLTAAHLKHLDTMGDTMTRLAETQEKMLPLVEAIHEQTRRCDEGGKG